MPDPLVWKELVVEGDVPAPRSGHTFICFDGKDSYLLYGGIDCPKKGNKPTPNPDIYVMRLSQKNCVWTKEGLKGKQPLIRTQQTAVLLPGKKIWMFGGHHNAQSRLNDTWFLDPQTFEWRQAKGEEGFSALDN